MDEQKAKCKYIIHSMEYCSVLKRKHIVQYVTTWMTLGVIMLNEISQSEKDT